MARGPKHCVRRDFTLFTTQRSAGSLIQATQGPGIWTSALEGALCGIGLLLWSVNRAKIALRIDKRLSTRWSRQKILNIIARQVNGDNRRVTIWRKNPALVNVMTSASMSWLLCASFTRIIFEQRSCLIWIGIFGEDSEVCGTKSGNISLSLLPAILIRWDTSG